MNTGRLFVAKNGLGMYELLFEEASYLMGYSVCGQGGKLGYKKYGA